MSASSLGGLWAFPSSTPNHDDFVFVDEGRQRIISFLLFNADPLKIAPIRHWYRAESAASLSVKLHLGSAWRSHEFKLTGDEVSWKFDDGSVHTWRRVPWEDRPDWFDARLAAQHAKMDATDEYA